jgi:YD repeat-containing protein
MERVMPHNSRSLFVRPASLYPGLLLLCVCAPAPGQSGNVVITANTTWAAGTYSLTSLTVQGGAVLTVGGGSTISVTGAILVTASSNIVLKSANNTAQVNGVWAGVGGTISAASLQVDSGSSINADAQGYVGSAGPGAGSQGIADGGSYGGVGGGEAVNMIYGSPSAPVDLGSGGNCFLCSGGQGGGAIQLIVSGMLTDNGVISANGQSVSIGDGGGSGGSVYVTTGTLAGAGVFTANGGSNSSTNGAGNGGGGGRIAVYFNSATNFTGLSNSIAAGGSSAEGIAGTNGTVAFVDTSVTNDNLDIYQDFMIVANSAITYNSINVRNGATLTIGGGSTVNVTGGVLVTGNSSIVLQSINNSAQVNNTWQGVGATLNAATVQVDPGSSINADGQGYVAVTGPGGGVQGNSEGASYGGVGGGEAASTIYGSASVPVALGSGGGQYQAPGGPGGGAVTLVVSGALINNGIISAEGGAASGFGGGGSGGSVYVTAGNLSGAGTFNADGGSNNTPYGGGGGGGRIAVYYASQTNYTGFATSTANGGTTPTGASPGPGTVGTVVFFDTSTTNPNLNVYQNYVIPSSTSVQYNTLTVANGATLTVGGGSQVAVAQAMHVTGTVIAQSINNTAEVNGVWAGQGVSFTAGSLLVDAGASINADSQGYAVLEGPGGGRAGDTAGGSYGGAGGGRQVTTTYGSAPTPVDLGSGGAHYQNTGGAGGGAIQITVSGTLTNNGIISANGQVASGFSGGGAGGSIYVTTATLAGTGTFDANGGNNATPYGGGGGGGRVAVYSASAANFTGFTASTANGGTTPAGASPGPGSVGTVAFFDTSVPNSNVSIYQNYVIPASTNVQYNSFTVNNGATVTVGGGSQVVVTGTLHVTGTMTAQSINNAGQVNGQWVGQGVKIIAGTAVIDPGASINADGQGYLTTVGPGSVPNAIGNNLGGSYGGEGGGQSIPTTYGSASNPIDLGSGGGISYGGGGGSGGGAIQLDVIGTLTNNGTISANGTDVTLDVGGGSGGSLDIAANTIAGTGTLTVTGGSNLNNNGGGGGGGGGRIAVYYINNAGFNLANATANGGVGSPSGSAGTVTLSNSSVTEWIAPTESVVHGVASLEWFTDNGSATAVTIAGPQTQTIATGSGAFTNSTWDTTQVPDGAYQLVLSVLNSSNQVVQQVDKSVVVNNSVAWHSGTLSSSQTWSGPQTQALDGDVIVPAGVTLTIAPGTVVKALPGAQIIVQSGGTLIATGNAGAAVTFTAFDDSTIGGDTDFNQGVSLPVPGEWNGIGVSTGGTFTSNTNTVILYAQTSLSGTLANNTTLTSTQVYTIIGTLVVPSGVTLNILPGAVVKFELGAGMDVQPGATLTANGTLAQPIYFTSINDSSVGGDTAGNGGAVAPAPGDWDSIILDGATVSLQHVQVQYGGGPVTTGSQTGMIETTESANVTITDSILAYSFAIGIQTAYPNGGGDTVTVTDSTFYGNEDRAINAYPGSTVHVVNDTFDGNSAGVMSHGGTVDVENSVISNSISTGFGGIAFCCGGSFAALENNDVYTTVTGASNYTGMSNPTGTNGNISADPVYMNGTLHDYRPTYGSPLIDAANGTVPNYPLTDAFGLARYNDPLVTTKTGTPDANGNYPDIGALEFVQTAPSNLDLTVANVQGPPTATVGTQVQVSWTVTNIGSGTVYGPWHDAVYLVSDPDTNPVETYAGIALEGVGAVLGPGAGYNATATVTVPGAVVGSHRWEVKTNVLGEIFEGANTNNNTGVSLNPVIIDLTQLVPGAGPIAGSFPGTGQSSFYKVIPNASLATRVQLALTAGSNGSVQLFVGGGYIPTPQHYDYQQVEFNSPTASVVIPADSTQIYYVTAYAQTIPVSPAGFNIQASAITFSLTSVTPNTAITNGNATLTFIGGGFTANTTFRLVGSSGTAYVPISTFLSDSGHADVTFAMTNLPADVYAAEAINGSTVTLANALTVTANQFGGGYGTNGINDVQVSLQTPEAFRTGFPSIVTLNYQNTASYDVAAPMIYISATNATLTELPAPCANCSSTFGVQNGSTFDSGLVLGISNSGPAGILPAGASGSIQFLATPTAAGTATFYVSGSAQNLVETRVEITNVNTQCTSSYGCVPQPVFLGAYSTGVDFCNSLVPPGSDPNGATRACMQLLNNMGFTYTPVSFDPLTGALGGIGQMILGYLPFTNFNNLLASDATALSAGGDYEYDVQKLIAYELQKDGLGQFNQRYHQGAFGFGASHPFDITVSSTYVGGGFLVLYPDGSQRVFPVPSPTQPGTFLGTPGDYGTFTAETDGSYLLTEPDGTLYHFHGGLGGLDYIQDRDGNRTTLTYTNGNMTSATDAFGNTISFQYDSYNHITQFTDAVGRHTTFTYDTVSETVNSITTTYEFLLTKTDATGTTNYTWNEGSSSGIGYIDDSCVTSYCGAPIGLASIAYPDGTHTYYQYDAAGRLIGQSNDNGTGALSYTYGSNGTVTSSDALGNATQTVPNVLGLPLQITDQLGNQAQMRYDAENKLTTAIGAKGDSTAIGHDSMGNIASLTSPTGNVTSVSYGPYQSLQSITDPNGNTSGYVYNSNYDATTQTTPNGTAVRRTFDSHGRPLTVTNRRGNTTTYTYGSNGLIATKAYQNGTNYTYTYDNHNNLISSTSPAGVTNLTYDSADRITRMTNPNGSFVKYSYNTNGQRSSLVTSTGSTTNYLYDSAGRLSAVTNGSGANVVSYTYDANNRITGKTLGNGATAAMTYDGNGNVLSVVNKAPSSAIISQYNYTYDTEDNISTMTGPNGTTTYGRDLNGQLTSVSTPTTLTTYNYDAGGNRTSVTTNNSTVPFDTNNLDEITSIGTSTNQYDQDGNLTSSNGTSFTYDDDDRLTSVSNSSGTTSYQYDGLGNTIASSLNGTTTGYLDDATSREVLAQFDPTSGVAAQQYTYGNGLASSTQSSGTSYYQYDGTGNTTQMTNSTGTVTNSYSYMPYGETSTQSASVPNQFTYDGQSGSQNLAPNVYSVDGSTYNSNTGGFQQPPSAGLTSGPSTYQVAQNSPQSTTSSSGGGIDYVSFSIGFIVNLGVQVNAHTGETFFSVGATPGGGVSLSGGYLAPDPNQTDRAAQTSDFLSGLSYNAGIYAGLGGGVTGNGTGDAAVEFGIGAGGHGGSANYAVSTYSPGVQNAFTRLNNFTGGWLFGTSPQDISNPNRPLSTSCPGCPPPPPNPCGSCIFNKGPGQNTPVHGAIDPNGKLTSGFGSPGYVPAGSAIVYTVYFENQPTATAPAQKVTVTDPLDSNLDWSTVQFNQIAFNNVTLDVPSGVQTYTTQTAVSSDPNPVNVSAALNPSTGVITWTMQSVDATTGSAPANPLAGFLPPNNSANAGSGYVTFSVMPKKTLANGATINNQASIVFDANAPIATNSVTNTVDSSSPTSAINPLPATTTSTAINVSWSGNDPSGSGIASYNIYEATDGGAYSLWLSATTLTSSTYSNALAGHTYSFYSLATNNVGAPQLVPATAQTISVLYLTPTVTVTPAASSITTTQSLSVTVTVSGGSGNPTPTGSVTLTSGTYSSSAVTISSGSATINIPAGSLAIGNETLTAAYAPDLAGSYVYGGSLGTSAVTVVGGSVTTTLTLGATPQSSSYGQQVMLSATLNPYSNLSNSTNGETVTFYNGAASVGTGTLSNGVAALSVAALPVGTNSLKAVYAGDLTFATSTSNTLIYAVSSITPTIVFTVANQTYGAASFTVTATSNSSGAITYSVVSGPATISGSTVTLTGAGTVVLQASQVAAGNYAAGTQTATFTVAGQAPTITFTVPNHTYGDAPFTVSATSNSSGVISYSVVSGPATVSGSTVTLTGAGTVVVQASQAASGGYTSGAKTATFVVATGSQTIIFTAPASPVNYGVAPISLSANASSGLAVMFSVLSGPASTNGSILTVTGAGTVVVAADQAGNTNYAAAAEVTHSIMVNKATPTAGLTASPNPVLVQNTVTLTATIASTAGTPTGSVVFSDGGTAIGTANLTGGVATMTVAMLTTGSHSITAAYGGDSNFNSVSSTAVSETVEDFTLTTGGSGSSQTVQPGGTANYTLPMSPSGGTTFPAAVSFSASGVPAGFTATFNPSSLSAGSPATNVTLMIQVPVTAMLEKSGQPGKGLPLVALGILALPFVAGIKRSGNGLRRLTVIVLIVIGIGGLSALTGCGGGGGSSSSGGGGNQPQTYNITVTATSGMLSHATTVTLIVQ